MIERTQEEVEKFFTEVVPEEYPGAHNLQGFELTVGRLPDGWRVQVDKMYSHVPLNFDFLSRVSEFFDTKNIAETSRYSSDGCDTCDYGSVYTINLEIRP